jgi:mRNA interferase MazF
MKRGEVWTVAGGADYTGKPRPAVILQDDEFDSTRSITVCLFTTNPAEAPLFRIRVELTEENGLREPSALMVDKITTVPRDKMGARVGRLEAKDIVRLNQAVLVFLGLARASRESA